MDHSTYFNAVALKPLFIEIFNRLLDGNNVFTSAISHMERGADFKNVKLSALNSSSRVYNSKTPTQFKQRMIGQHANLHVSLQGNAGYVGKPGQAWALLGHYKIFITVESNILKRTPLLQKYFTQFHVETDFIKYSQNCTFSHFVINELYTPIATSAKVYDNWCNYVEQLRKTYANIGEVL